MKTLSIIQKLCKIGKILSKIAFICAGKDSSLYGACTLIGQKHRYIRPDAVR